MREQNSAYSEGNKIKILRRDAGGFLFSLYPAPSRIPPGLVAGMNGEYKSFPWGVIPRGEGAGFI